MACRAYLVEIRPLPQNVREIQLDGQTGAAIA